jgi:hypothetical protein
MRRFLEHFALDSSPGTTAATTDVPKGILGMDLELTQFFRAYSGVSFNNGLYRIHLLARMDAWTARVVEAFPGFRDRITCFACDWLGRQFALDHSRMEKAGAMVLMFEPGTGESLDIAASFHTFHNQELVEHANEALALDFRGEWFASGGEIPSLCECIGYITPLFLGGSDSVENLELTDMEVYWSVSAQLISKVRNLPDGTHLGHIDIQ